MKEKYKNLIGILTITASVYLLIHGQSFGAVFNITPAPIATTGEYQIVSGVKGYVSKPDPTNIAPEYLVSGSQNVVINDQERVETRAGYELFGVASTTDLISSDYVWRNSGATSTVPSEIMLRVSGTVLQYYATSSFENLFTLVSTSSPVRFASVWDGTENMDILLFVNASSTLFEWSGGQGTFSSDTSNTIVLNDYIDESRFLLSGLRQIRVKDTSGNWQLFTYTGISDKTFTGVTPDPTGYTIGSGATVVQAVRSNLRKPASKFVSDTIKVLNNQVWIGSQYSRQVYVSSNASSTDFSFSSPRVPGEGALITLDDATIGFESPDDDKMLIFSGKDRIYQVSFEISAGDTGDREVPKVKPLLVSSGQGTLSQELIGKIKQAVVWVSNNKELVEYGQIENLPNPQSATISDPIKPDFINADFTNGEIEFWRNNIFITAPPDGKIFIYDLSKGFWQPPQVMGMRRLSQYRDLLYGHGQSVAETYKLFTGLSDDGNDIEAKAHFSYVNGGRRDALKNFNRFFTEMYLASNTKVDVSILYDWLGSKGIVTYELDGADTTFLFIPESGASLGVNPLGTNPLGGVLSSGSDLSKYRRFKPLVPKDFFEYQVRIESNASSTAWQILSTGANVSLSNNSPTTITK